MEVETQAEMLAETVSRVQAGQRFPVVPVIAVIYIFNYKFLPALVTFKSNFVINNRCN